MRGTVSKKLRKECKGMPRLVHQLNKTHTYRVNHYRNSKKAYNGSIDEAVLAAMNKASQNEILGIYK